MSIISSVLKITHFSPLTANEVILRAMITAQSNELKHSICKQYCSLKLRLKEHYKIAKGLLWKWNSEIPNVRSKRSAYFCCFRVVGKRMKQCIQQLKYEYITGYAFYIKNLCLSDFQSLEFLVFMNPVVIIVFWNKN